MPSQAIAQLDFPGGRIFQLVQGNLLEEQTDAIVNAANSYLAHGAGVALAIGRAAGEEFARESHALVARHGPVPVGEAAVTTAGRLPFQGVIHAIGPRLGDGDEGDKLASALRAAFLRAHERVWKSVAFPAVSSGVFAVPLEVCARAYVRAAREFFAAHPDSSVRTLRLCVFPGPLTELVKREMTAPE